MFERPYYLNQLIKFKDSDFIKVITGVRRSGKSVLLCLYRHYLIEQGISKDTIIYINFESFEHQTITNESEFRKLLTPYLAKANQEKLYFLFDEIQFVEGWQSVVNGLRVSYQADVVITGSNAKMLSGELATLLSGRYIEIPIYPLSFKEYLVANQIDPKSRYVDRAYQDYEKYGGFPSVVLSDDSLKDTILSGIFDSIVLNDIAYRSSVKDTAVLRAIIQFLSDNVGQLVNPNKIVGVLKNEKIKTSSHTVNRYLEFLENAYLFYRVRQYDIRGKDYLKIGGKFFIADNGLRRHAIGQKDGNYSNRLENIVYLELLRRGYTIDIGKLDTKEIDFIARKQDQVLYVQVAYQIPENSHETDNLLHIKDGYEKIVITGRYDDRQQIDGIPIRYIVDWLLEE